MKNSGRKNKAQLVTKSNRQSKDLASNASKPVIPNVEDIVTFPNLKSDYGGMIYIDGLVPTHKLNLKTTK